MNHNNLEPYMIDFPKIGTSNIGYISVSENHTLPFEVRRIYWTYFTPDNISRGRHAHYELEQILLAVSGKIAIRTESLGSKKNEFILDRPNQGLFLPKFCWHEMSYSHNSVQVCIASMEYSESDYIRDYEAFKNLSSK